MAQQIAQRLHCDRRGTRTIAFHPTCHLELHEHAGYAHLHGLKAELIGDRDRLIELDDLKALPVPVGAILLELPQREIGGQLPEWDDLVAQVDWARDCGAALHLDGARIWETAPYDERSHSEIAGLFDTVYVSLYKGLLGLSGSILAGRMISSSRRGYGADATAEPWPSCFRLWPPRARASKLWFLRCRGSLTTLAS
jgi:threonine aldolase